MSPNSSLYRHLRIYQVFGANTAVGKTVFSTIICKALTKHKLQTRYLKPVSTGPLSEADDRHIKTFAPDTATTCLFQFGDAVSPHLAASARRNPSPVWLQFLAIVALFFWLLIYKQPPPDDLIINSVMNSLKSNSKSSPHGHGVVLVETAGGVHSPTPSGNSQADLYRPLRLPILLVADPKLGGISSTISAFESLHIRGYDLDSVLVFQDSVYQNYKYLSDYFAKKSITTVSLPPPPIQRDVGLEDEEAMAYYYDKVSGLDAVSEFLTTSLQRHQSRILRLENMAKNAHSSIWYPFTQHQKLTEENIVAIDSAYGDFFQTVSTTSTALNNHSNETTGGGPYQRENILTPKFDGSASWWTQGLGHGSPTLSLAAAYAAGRYGHVMFAGAVHEPALSLAELLLKRLENSRLAGGGRVFYSDNGSTGVEVAVKMALKAAGERYGWESGSGNEVGVLGLKGSYHGDTIGAMDCSEGSAYNKQVHWYQGKGYWLDFPQVKMKDGVWVVESPPGMEDLFGEQRKFGSLGEIFDAARDISDMRDRYEEYIIRTLERVVKIQGLRLGALILEPLILGAGGMLFCDPLFQRTLINTVRSNPHIFAPKTSSNASQSLPQLGLTWSGLPVIFDEVFTGIYRLGHFSPSTMLQSYPDISVHAKLLTGGLVPLCATVASDAIFSAFLGDKKELALLHGHSYTAHAIGCEVAHTSLLEMVHMDQSGVWDGYKRDWEQERDSKKLVAKTEVPIWSVWGKEFVDQISKARDVESVVTLGSILAINLLDREGGGLGYTSNAAAGLQRILLSGEAESPGTGDGFDVHSRVLGNVLYLMASQVSEEQTLKRIQEKLVGILC